MLGVQNRGYLALIILWPTILARLGGTGLPLALPYFVSRDAASAYSTARSVVRPAVIQMSAVALVHGAVLLAFLPGKPADVRAAGLLSLAAGPLSLALEYLLALLQGQQRFGAFNVLRTGPAALYGILALALFVLGLGQLPFVAAGLIGGLLVSVIASAIVVTCGLASLPKSSSRKHAIGRMIGFGLRGLPGAVSPLETLRLDQAVIGLFLTPAALGLYVVGLAFTNLPRFIAQSIGMVAYPHIAGRRDNRSSSMWSFFWLTVGLSAVVVLVLIATAPLLVPAIFGKQFSDAVTVTRILLIGSLFFAARRVLTDASRAVGRPSAGSIAEIASWVCLLLFVAVLLPRLGIQGVAIALTSAAAFSFLVLCVIVLRDRPTKEDSAETVGVAVGL
jgi:O-antigen/teichoic acid export membrane protein